MVLVGIHCKSLTMQKTTICYWGCYSQCFHPLILQREHPLGYRRRQPRHPNLENRLEVKLHQIHHRNCGRYKLGYLYVRAFCSLNPQWKQQRHNALGYPRQRILRFRIQVLERASLMPVFHGVLVLAHLSLQLPGFLQNVEYSLTAKFSIKFVSCCL